MIGTKTYKILTDILGEAQELGDLSLEGMLDIKESLKTIDANPLERYRRQLFAFNASTYSYIASKHIRMNKSLKQMVLSINNHVLNKYQNESIDEFLEEQYIAVSPSYASLSGFIGENITKIGSDSGNWEDIGDFYSEVSLNWNKIGWENI